MTEHVQYEVWEHGQLIDTFDGLDMAIYSVEQFGCDESEIIEVIRDGQATTRTVVYSDGKAVSR